VGSGPGLPADQAFRRARRAGRRVLMAGKAVWQEGSLFVPGGLAGREGCRAKQAGRPGGRADQADRKANQSGRPGGPGRPASLSDQEGRRYIPSGSAGGRHSGRSGTLGGQAGQAVWLVRRAGKNIELLGQVD
jgi:hypothetical protein